MLFLLQRYCTKGHEVDGVFFAVERRGHKGNASVGPHTKLLKKRNELRVNYNLKQTLRLASYPGLPMFFNVSHEKSGRLGHGLGRSW